MIPQLPDDLLGRLSGFATTTFGLRFPPDRWNELARGIASAALELGISDLEGWAESLVAGAVPSEQVAALANHLTISETYFFRHPETFVTLEHDILPDRVAERKAHAQALRIWSAGCASGEEPYSVAILLAKHFPEFAAQRVIIHATDINAHVLARARRGSYTEWSFRDAPPWLKAGYFVRGASGRFELTAPIRQMVRFTQLNLAAPLYPGEFGERGNFDVILCRNVLMYFSAQWQERIVQRLAQALAPGGWLLVGPCDMTAAQAAALRLRLQRPGTYRKSTGAETGSAAASALPPVEWRVHAPVTGIAEPPSAELALPFPPRADAAPSPPVNAIAHSQSGPLVSKSETTTPPDDLSAQARTHADRGELAEALAACEAAIAKSPLEPELHYLRGCVLVELDRRDEASAAYHRVLYLEPGFAMAEFALGSLAQRDGRAEQARHHFSRVLRLLAKRHRGEAVPHSEGLTVARLQEVVGRTLQEDAA